MLQPNEVGAAFTRAELAQHLGYPAIRDHREGIFYAERDAAALLFVTLEKEGREADLQYNDWFEGNQFHWDSQKKQHFYTPRITQMVLGELEVHLLVRVDAEVRGVTQPYIYAGRLRYLAHDIFTANPVNVTWLSLDYVDAAHAALQAVYNWTPGLRNPNPDRSALRVNRAIGTGQGRQPNTELRQLIERRAMDVAEAWYSEREYAVQDTSKNRPYDLECTLRDHKRRVEVKGTAGRGDTVLLTRNEIFAAREGGIPTDLFIVYGISVRLEGERLVAQGGDIRLVENWMPLDAHLTATAFQYVVPNH